jgi:hypothetical protein
MAKKWTDARWRQLGKLEDLLSDCESINNANNITLRLKRLILGARSLRKASPSARRSSFVTFLKELAIGDERGN